MKNKNVILDTNLWISFLISKDYSFLDNYVLKGKVKLVFSEELFAEFISITERPKFKKYFSKSDVDKLIQTIDKYGILIKVTSEIKLCRDIKDNFLLNLAADSNADFLVTGDKDLLEIKNLQKTKILTIRELIDEL
jgi:putative PIN family toxin of toxin-antitoxin system